MSQPTSPSVTATLTRLSRETAPDPLRDMIPLRRHLQEVLHSGLSPAQQQELATALLPRLAAAEEALLALLRNASLPLAPPLRTLTVAMGQIHELQVRMRQCPEASLLRQMLIVFLSGTRLPAGFWRRTREAMATHDASARLPGAMLALAAAQPESFSPPELLFLASLLSERGDGVYVQTHRPAPNDEWYWLDCAQDQLPVALRRRPPPREGDLIYFHCADLGKHFASRLAHLEAGIPVRQLNLSATEEDQTVCIGALRRALMHWTNPPTRNQGRRQGNHRVQVCTRLGEIWDLLRDGATGLNRCSDWLVLNETPCGYALMHLSGETGGLVAGSVLGLRPTPATPWSIWMVRWVRAENGDNLEVGLELLAPGATAVRITTGNAATEPMAALLLTAPPRLDQREALLIPRETTSRRDFTLLTESGERIKLTSCRPGPLRHQTSSVEIFEFERLPLT